MSKWKDQLVTDFSAVLSGATPSTNNPTYWNGEINWITPADLSKLGTRHFDRTERRLSKEGLRSCAANLLPAFSVVMSSRAPIGYFAVGKTEFATNQGCKSFLLKNGQDADFHYYNFMFNVRKFLRLGSGSTFAEVSKKDIESIFFKIPTSCREQRRIARILTTVDKVIEQTESAIEKLKKIKQGMMHDLFTRGIDVRTGKLRLPYSEASELYKETELGWIPKDWELDTIKNVSKKIWIGLVTTMTTHYVESGIPLIRNNNIKDNEIDTSDIIFLDNAFSEQNKQRYLHKGDIVTVHTGDIGTSAIVPDSLDPSHGFATINTTVNERIIINIYLCDYFNTSIFKNRIEAYATGDGRSNFNLYDYLYISVPFPKLIDEQNAISAKLLSARELQCKEIDRLDKFIKVKQGLMQDLLTGKIEVLVKEEEIS